MKAKIVRVESSKDGTFGALLISGYALCVTLEPTWKDNKVYDSCIPAGKYVCKRRYSERFGDTFEVAGISGRTDVMFHIGNTVEDTTGCVLLGSCFGKVGRTRGILMSAEAIRKFKNKLANVDEFGLEIVSAYNQQILRPEKKSSHVSAYVEFERLLANQNKPDSYLISTIGIKMIVKFVCDIFDRRLEKLNKL